MPHNATRMARNRRPRELPAGGPDPKRQKTEVQEKAIELAHALVGAHLEGYIQRKRLYMFEKRRLNQDLQNCLDKNMEHLTKRMHNGDETVEFCFQPTYRFYAPTREEVLAALPPHLQALEEGVEWPGVKCPEGKRTPFTITVTWAGDPRVSGQCWVVGIEVDKHYLQMSRKHALEVALKSGDDVEPPRVS